MCGITGYIGNQECYPILLDGLKQLQNRGYDSAGIATINYGEVSCVKHASDTTSAIQKLEQQKLSGNIGIGHTRWATHGPKTDANSHPHWDNNGEFYLVHNGIIENYREIQTFLTENNYKFYSETDTETIVNLLHYYYQKCKNISTSIQSLVKDLQGTYALCILSVHQPHSMYCVRHGSPLLISVNEKSVYIASEQSGFCGQTSSYFCLESGDICELVHTGDKVTVSTQKNYQNRSITQDSFQKSPAPYPYWTIREIYEQVESCKRAISFGGRLLSDNQVKIGGLCEYSTVLQTIDNLVLLGCGTSYHAGMVGISYFKELCNFNTIQLFDGSDFDISDVPKIGKTALIFLSQSGETKDLHRCIEIGQKHNLFMIGVVNVVDSLIAREVHCGCYLNAGREVGVASTKSFTSQCIVLCLMSLWFSQIQQVNMIKRLRYIRDLRRLAEDFSVCIENSLEICEKISVSLQNKNNMFLLGKGIGEAIAKEGSLKIKEISYIHSEGYSGSSLKHGPFELLESGFTVILIDPKDQYHVKMENVYEEIKSRHAQIITITDDIDINRENKIVIPSNTSFRDLLCIIPLQILAYYLSINRGYNPDFPRNLAKCVTTE